MREIVRVTRHNLNPQPGAIPWWFNSRGPDPMGAPGSDSGSLRPGSHTSEQSRGRSPVVFAASMRCAMVFISNDGHILAEVYLAEIPSWDQHTVYNTIWI